MRGVLASRQPLRRLTLTPTVHKVLPGKYLKYHDHIDDLLAPKALDPYEWGAAYYQKTWGEKISF